jgi:hypothetical protein
MSCVACAVGAGIGSGGSFPGSGDAFARYALYYSIDDDSGSVKVVLQSAWRNKFRPATLDPGLVALGMAQASLSTRAMPVVTVSPSPALSRHLTVHVRRAGMTENN